MLDFGASRRARTEAELIKEDEESAKQKEAKKRRDVERK